MRRFVLKTALFLAPALLLSVLLELLLRHIPQDYSLKKNYLDQHAGQIETLILGSSHALYGLDPTYFESPAFNASYVSQPLYYDYALLRQYENRLSRLSCILLPISYFSLYDHLGLEPWRLKNYAIYYGLEGDYSLSDYTEVLSNRLGVQAGRAFSYYIKKKEEISCNPLGWGMAFRSENALDLEATAQTAAARHHTKDLHSERSQQLLRRNMEALEGMVAWAKARQVRILLFLPPASEAYRRRLQTEQLQMAIQAGQDLDSRYGHVYYVNLLEDERFTASDYYDADHLSEKGAKKLSEMMNEFVKKHP